MDDDRIRELERVIERQKDLLDLLLEHLDAEEVELYMQILDD